MKYFRRIIIPGLVMGGILLFNVNVHADEILLKKGMRNDQVKQAQVKLKELGYFDVKATGYYGSITQQSVKNYQRDENFTVDGIIGQDTWNALTREQYEGTVVEYTRMLKKSMRGEDVKQLQTKLKELGYLNVDPTGYYGNLTVTAVKQYQSDNNCAIDGIVGKNTWTKLMESIAQDKKVSTNFNRVLKKGMKGPDIKKVQNKLKELGYFNKEATGYYGSITRSAVMDFQKDKNLMIDGLVGENTWQIMMDSKPSNSESEKFNRLLEKGMRGQDVKQAQKKLKELGYFNANATGYYGLITKRAVINYQSSNGCVVDGVIGSGTWSKLFNNGNSKRVIASRGSEQRHNPLISWNTVKNIFKRDTVAKVVDVETGIEFKVKRTMGYRHADVETLTSSDTYKLKQAYGGSWSWKRRAIVVIVNGRKIAGSMNGVPHCGIEEAPAYKYVSGRSGGFGWGQNLDTIKGNSMEGHICFHFLNSTTHGTGSVDSDHQQAVRKAAQYINNH